MFSKSEMREYGYHKLIREYSGYPRWLPLPCHYDHGVTFIYDVCPNKLCRTPKKLMLVFNSLSLKIWIKDESVLEQGISVYNIGNPFVHHRRKHDLKVLPQACGTIVFPSHTTDLISADFNLKKYCTNLMDLPKEFQPLTICIHWSDYLKKTHLAYEEMGFNVVTVGDIYNEFFCDNFYGLLRRHKYVTSNFLGSYVCYAIEMGIPFFIYGDEPEMFNFGGDPFVPEKFKITDFESERFAYNLFSTGPTQFITDVQRKYALNVLGVDDCISSNDLNEILWKFYLNDSKLKKYTLKCYFDFALQPIMKPLNCFKKFLKHFPIIVNGYKKVRDKIIRKN